MNKFYLKEFQYFDGEAFITFNIVNLDSDNKTVKLAISNRGRISVVDYDLLEDENGFYFEYGTKLRLRPHLKQLSQNRNLWRNLKSKNNNSRSLI